MNRAVSPSLGLAFALLVTSCDRQPTVAPSNATTESQLATIAAHTNETDGMNQGNDLLMSTPTVGQQMSAQQQPPKQQ